jgi:hypothetical protein
MLEIKEEYHGFYLLLQVDELNLQQLALLLSLDQYQDQ